MYAKHSLFYPSLPSYFLLFSIWDDFNRCLSWDETVEWANLLGIYTVPVIWRGTFDSKTIENIMPYPPLFGEAEPEGYVVRVADSFSYENFGISVAKWVRAGHVQTDQHWSHTQNSFLTALEIMQLHGLEDGPEAKQALCNSLSITLKDLVMFDENPTTNTDPNVWINGAGDVRIECPKCGYITHERTVRYAGHMEMRSSESFPCACEEDEDDFRGEQ